jgi:hypothetical protein
MVRRVRERGACRTPHDDVAVQHRELESQIDHVVVPHTVRKVITIFLHQVAHHGSTGCQDLVRVLTLKG